ncbi:Uncharacterised protein [uncultured archaeon]|nr:Uncharacterised protein [uncultured archaeon]
MKYLLPISYQNGDTEKSRDFAINEKDSLEKLAEEYNGVSSFTDILNPNFSFEKHPDLVEFRRALVKKTKEDLFHYNQIYAELTTA